MENERTKNVPLYHHKNRRNCSATVNLLVEAQWFAQTLKDMPKTAFIVWHALSAFTQYQNVIDTRLSEIAEFCGLSLGSVQRAMNYFEEKEVLVRLSGRHEDSVWRINPELRWNGKHDQQPLMATRFKYRCRENKKQERDLKKNQQQQKSVMIQTEEHELQTTQETPHAHQN